MEKIRDERALQDWLNHRKMEFACVLAVRAALRVVPVLEIALYEDAEERRRTVILPCFRTLAAANFASAWPGHAAKVGKVARSAGQEASAAIKELVHGAGLYTVEGLEVAQCAVDAAGEATQSIVSLVDAGEGIASSAAVVDAAVEAARFAHSAIDGFHRYTDLSYQLQDGESGLEIVPHIVEFWKAVTLDLEWLETSANAEAQPEDTVAGLSEEALWLGGTPVWASRQWADFRDRLPQEEGWEVWIGWYESRLAGRRLDAKLETDLLNVASEDWSQGPAHINAILAELNKSRSDPMLVAMTRGFEEWEEVKQVSSADLRQHSERISDALPNDPYQAIGATKDMLEATMKTILDRRGHGEIDNLDFPQLTSRCLKELGLKGSLPPTTESERFARKIASNAQTMIETANKFRNRAGTGHGRAAGKEPIVSIAHARLVASAGLILAAWLLHHEADG